MRSKLILMAAGFTLILNGFGAVAEMSIPLKSKSEAELKSWFNGRFGSARFVTMEVEGFKIIAVFHDKGSGVVIEDQFLFQQSASGELKLIGLNLGASIVAKKVTIEHGQAKVLDSKGKLMLSVQLRAEHIAKDSEAGDTNSPKKLR